MNRRHLWTLAAAITLGLGLPALAAGGNGNSGGNGGGNSGSHGGSNNGSGNQGNASAGTPPQADAKGKHNASSTGKNTQTRKTVAQQLEQRKQLSTQLGQLLPAGTDLQAAAAGFKNLGQFVAAVHVSKNLGIPFADLKARMMDGASLGAAIKALRPDVNANTEATKAQRQANRDIAGRR